MSTGYGVDTWCGSTLVPGRMARGTQLVALALFRRYTTPRGTLQGLLDGSGEFAGGDEEGAYGFDVSTYVGATGVDRAVAALPAIMKAEAEKDDRVASVKVSIARDDRADGTTVLTISIAGTLQDSGEDFALTIGVDSVSATLVGVS